MGLSAAQRRLLAEDGCSNIAPYKLRMADRPELYQRFRQMVDAAGMQDTELYVADHNGLFIGATQTFQATISPKLLGILTDDEALAVLAQVLRNAGNENNQQLWSLSAQAGAIVAGGILLIPGLQAKPEDEFPRRKAMKHMATAAAAGLGVGSVIRAVGHLAVSEENGRAIHLSAHQPDIETAEKKIGDWLTANKPKAPALPERGR